MMNQRLEKIRRHSQLILVGVGSLLNDQDLRNLRIK